MAAITADLAISLDGFIAGSGVSAEHPAGDGGELLHEWFATLASWRRRQGLPGGVHNRDSEIIEEWFEATGAVVMGRRMFDSGEGPWGADPPFRAPVFVVTHRPRPVLVKQGGTSFTFVTEGIHSALAQARAAAGGRNVDIAGGADTVQQFLGAGLLDELQLHVVPVLLGRGLRLFDRLDLGPTKVEPVDVVRGVGAVHLKYRVVR